MKLNNLDHNNGNKTIVSWILIVLFILIAAMMIPRDTSKLYNYEKGEIIRQTIIAPYDFDILKPERVVNEEKEKALEKTPIVFNLKLDIVDEQDTKISHFFQLARAIQQRYKQMQISEREKNLNRYVEGKYVPLLKSFRTDSIAFSESAANFNDQFSVDIHSLPFSEIYKPQDLVPINLIDIEKNISSLLLSVFENGIIDIPKSQVISHRIAISESGEEILVSKENIFDREESTSTLVEQVTGLYPEFNHEKRQLIAQIIPKFIEPNLIYDKERTENRQNDIIGRIPIVQGKVLKDEKIVDANTKVTADILLKLNSLNFSANQIYSQNIGTRYLLKFGSDFLAIGIFLSIFVIFLIIYDKNFRKNIKHILLLSVILIIVLFIAYFLVGVSNFPPITVPILITALLLSVFFGSQIAIFGSIVELLIMAYIFGNHFQFILLHSLPIMIGILSFRKLRTRDQIFMTMFWVFIGYIITIISTELAIYSEYNQILHLLYFALLNTVASILITYGLVILFEKIFDITTDMTLLELSDLNRPILKELGIKAPGTYHHCVMVGNLAEAAAEAIGANPLLTRVGAYYHDIGKISKAEYFIENQKGGENKLNQLKPHMAARVVINHVREGLELARKYKIPRIVTDFIPTHHGTTTVAYFYAQAFKDAEDPDTVDENDFKYNGPLPNTKETGILMLVEALEAAVRSIAKPNYNNIQQMVTKIFKNRLDENQLDECPLTLAEMDQIKKAVIPILTGMYHIRVKYPETQKGK